MSEKNKAGVRAYVDAFNRGDFDALRAAHTPDAVVRGVLGWGSVDEVMPIWRDLVNCLAMHLKIEAIIAKGELVAMEFFEMKDGKIHRRWGARDAASQARQLGWS